MWQLGNEYVASARELAANHKWVGRLGWAAQAALAVMRHSQAWEHPGRG